MTYHVLPPGSRVRVTSYGPFREHWGTVRDMHMIDAALEEPFCFYLIALDSGQRKEPIWFDFSEVELITSSLVALQEHQAHDSASRIWVSHRMPIFLVLSQLMH